MKYCYLIISVRLACLIHAASVRSEPESNSPLKNVSLNLVRWWIELILQLLKLSEVLKLTFEPQRGSFLFAQFNFQWAFECFHSKFSPFRGTKNPSRRISSFNSASQIPSLIWLKLNLNHTGRQHLFLFSSALFQRRSLERSHFITHPLPFNTFLQFF